MRANLVERGLAIDQAQFAAVLTLLRIDDHESVAAVQWDRHQVTVIRHTVVRQRIAGPGLTGPATFIEHTHQTRQHIPIINTTEPR